MDWTNPEDLRAAVKRLSSLPRETEWLEFKENNANPEEIGAYISCLANAATFTDQEYGFMVWGVRDSDHEIVGTNFRPRETKIGNEDLVPWLARLLEPRAMPEFFEVDVEGHSIVLLRVPAAERYPVTFKKTGYLRVGTYKKKLADYPEIERALWAKLGSFSFEYKAALKGLQVEDLVRLLDYPAFFRLRQIPLPERRSGIVEALEAARLISYSVVDEWSITSAGGLLYAANLNDFHDLRRKAPRVVRYVGTSRVQAQREQVGQRGYAAGFEGLIGYVSDLLPMNEVIGASGLRLDEAMVPRLVIRELIANALIHQDFTISGTGPIVEIFDDRVEITNPGQPLLDPLRFIDLPPRSRNEFIASEMRLIGVAEERGSGWDKITFQIELHQLPPAQVEVPEEQTRVRVSAPKPLNSMDKPERSLAVYQHACLRYVSNEPTNNMSVRGRFGISDRNKAKASGLIREATEMGYIRPYDASAGPRLIRYVPFWAASTDDEA